MSSDFKLQGRGLADSCSAVFSVCTDRSYAPVRQCVIRPRGPYALQPTFCCGQTFRFSKEDCGIVEVCGDIAVHLVQRGIFLNGSFIATAGGQERIEDLLSAQKDVEGMAAESCAWLCRRYPDRSTSLRAVFAYSRGVHLLHQPILETIVGYLLSVQSSVSLVGKRLDALAHLFPSCRRLFDGREVYLFPTLVQLRSLTPSMLAELRFGYRTAWLEKLLRDLPQEQDLMQLASARPCQRQKFFRRFDGIGPKVAACIDLFAYGNVSAFPVDVWVERGLRNILQFSDQMIARVRLNPLPLLGPCCGLFGEYLFRYERDSAAEASGISPF